MSPRTAATCLLFCFCFIGTKGSSSEQRFIQTNHNLLLSPTKEVQRGDDTFYWKFNNRINIVRLTTVPVISTDYKNRVEFFPQNLSLILKNVQLSDSGIYTAGVFGERDETVDRFEVVVEDPVSAVSLSLDSVSNSSDSCNFTVSCRTELFNISRSFTCDTHSCEEAQHSGHAHSGSSPLNVMLSNGVIVCNHSNHVSWRNDTKEKQQVCSGAGGQSGGENRTAVIVVVVLCVVLTVIALFVFLHKRRRRRRMIIQCNQDNTLYAQVKAHTSIVESPTSGQSSVEQRTASVQNPVQNPVQNQVQNPVQNPVQKPESVYATVNKPTRIKS